MLSNRLPPLPAHHCRAAAFHRPYAGPQGRRQALLSFVSEGGTTCTAVPPQPAPPGIDADGAAGPAGDSPQALPVAPAGGELPLSIPRRLQHKQGLGRRLSLQPAPPSPQVRAPAGPHPCLRLWCLHSPAQVLFLFHSAFACQAQSGQTATQRTPLLCVFAGGVCAGGGAACARS
jgi:hypothetical protein